MLDIIVQLQLRLRSDGEQAESSRNESENGKGSLRKVMYFFDIWLMKNVNWYVFCIIIWH